MTAAVLDSPARVPGRSAAPARVLPGFLQGVFTVGMLATIMSTVDSYAFIAAVTLGRDIVGRWRGHTEDQARWAVQWSLAVTAAVTIVMALVAGSVITLWKVLGSAGTPVLLLPLALAHTRWRVGGRRVAVAMAAAGLVSAGWLALGHGGPWLGIEAIFPGLLVSVLVLAPAWLPGGEACLMAEPDWSER